MGLKLFSVNHRDHDLYAVEQLTPLIHNELERELSTLPGVKGVVVLSTCNRIEIILDVDEGGAVDHVVVENAREFSGIEVVRHLSLLACGLESMVVGEREIAGQLRHALKRAERRETLSSPIATALDTAFRAARQVERATGLSGMGRSIAAIALNHAEQYLGDYRDVTVTLFGTGSYAGAAVTQLKERGCRNIYVHSASGRAEAFANGRGLQAVQSEDLEPILAKTDLIVSARGTGSPTVTSQHVRTGMAARAKGVSRAESASRTGISSRPEGAPRAEGAGLVVLDLAIVRDVDPEVAQIPGVTLIDLDTVRSLVPKLEPMKTEQARRIVEQVVSEHEKREAARVIDPVIVDMRSQISGYIEQEMAKLPNRALQEADVEKALRRLTNRLLHHPTTAAHRAGARGEADEFIAALKLVTGMSFDDKETA